MRLPDFQNEALSDFKGNRELFRLMQEAVAQVGTELGREYDLVIGGERLKTSGKFLSINPSQKDQVVGIFSKGNAELADRAIRTAERAFKSWARTPVEQRVQLLLKTADILRHRKYYYAAWMVYEVGKTWPEADADIAEAIDFAEFYAREMVRLAGRQPVTPVPGEKNYLQYLPLGVGIVIRPGTSRWQFWRE